MELPLPGFLTRQSLPPAAGGGRVRQDPLLCCLGLLGPPTLPPHFLLPLPKPQRAGGPTAPSSTPSPKAQAPWQRPRRQGGVCQRHLSLTSSITGHHGNTHDSTQEGLQSSPPSSLHPASAEPKLETPIPLGSEKSQFSLPTPGSGLHHWTMAFRSLCQPHPPHNTHTHTNWHPSVWVFP